MEENVPILPPKDPLKIPEMLEAILQYVADKEDGDNIRFVHPFWNQVSVKKWRRSAILQITLGLINRFYEEENRLFETNLYELCHEDYAFFNLTLMTFNHYQIPFYHMSFPPNRSRHQEIFFYEKLGPHIKFLDMEQCWFKRNRKLEGLEWILKHCNILEEFKIMPYLRSDNPEINLVASGGLYSDSEDEDKEVPGSCEMISDNAIENSKLTTLIISSLVTEDKLEFRELFEQINTTTRFLSWVPNLKNLVVTAQHSSPVFMEALSRPINGRFLRNLEKLHITLNGTPRTTNLCHFHTYLQGGSPPLRDLTIQTNVPAIDNEHLRFREAVDSISDSLESFSVTFDEDNDRWRMYNADDDGLDEPVEVAIPFYFQLASTQTIFNRLTHFHLQFNFVPYSFSNFPIPVNLITLKNMPLLKQFCFAIQGQSHISTVQFIELSIAFGIEGPGPDLEGSNLQLLHLEEFSYAGVFAANSLNTMGTHWMPNVKRFEAIFTVQIITALIPLLREGSAFRHLEKLVLHPNSNLHLGHPSLQQLTEILPNLTVEHSNIPI